MALVTNAGLANVMAAWNAYASRPLWLQLGTGSGQTASSNDVATAVEDRSQATTSVETTNITGDTFRISGSVTATAENAITELGVFDDVVGGNMDFYGEFNAVDLAIGDALVFSVSIVVS